MMHVFCGYQNQNVDIIFLIPKEEKTVSTKKIINDCISFMHFISHVLNWMYTHTFSSMYLFSHET